jgi:hypothetical protein
LRGLVEKAPHPYQKPCKFCGQTSIYWSDISHCFTDTPGGVRHQCASSSAKDRQLEQDKRLNEMINDVKSQMTNQHNDEVQRIDALQRAQAHQNSLLVEIRAKLDGALRGYS